MQNIPQAQHVNVRACYSLNAATAVPRRGLTLSVCNGSRAVSIWVADRKTGYTVHERRVGAGPGCFSCVGRPRIIAGRVSDNGRSVGGLEGMTSADLAIHIVLDV